MENLIIDKDVKDKRRWLSDTPISKPLKKREPLYDEVIITDSHVQL